MTSALCYELADLFRREQDAITQPYAWPPRPLSVEERREADRLDACARGLRYRGDVAAYEEQS